MKHDKQYYEENYSGLETSEEVIDALEEIAAAENIDFMTLWEEGKTDVYTPEEIEAMVSNYIMENVPECELQETYNWGAGYIHITNTKKLANRLANKANNI